MNDRIEEAIAALNDRQREAVTTTDGPMLVIAGAGSGKTKVLTTKIALLMAKGVNPDRILALTFTKKAAEEMRERIIALGGEEARRICMGTFHSVFIRFLRMYADRIYFPNNFTILDEDDSMGCLKRCIDEIIGQDRPPKESWTKEMTAYFKEQDERYKPKFLHSVFSLCKNELVTPEKYNSTPERTEKDKIAKRPLAGKIFTQYRDVCHRMAMMDFDDILLYTDMLLANNPDVQKSLSSMFDYILVDEYQDTNVAQYSILRRLSQDNRNLCVVGDDSQSIYAFRGARIENILRFPKDYPGCRVIKLEKNYRSTKNIVNAANNLIKNNESRLDKTCFTEGLNGSPIHIVLTDTEVDEATDIVETISEKCREQGKSYSDFAVLYRTNAQSRVLEDAMVRARIPYMIYSGTSFFERAEVKDLMAYFKLCVNPYDDESFKRVVNKPVRGFGQTAMKKLQEIATAWGMPMWEAANNPSIALCGFTSKALQGLGEFCSQVWDFRQKSISSPAYETAAYISDKVGFYGDYMLEGDEDSLKRADNIRELVDSVKAYEDDAAKDGTEESPSLAGYLQNALLLSNADTSSDDKNKVSMMTVHCAKGLEFDTVFIAGVERYLFPLEIDKTAFEREEERRLFYVAMTRAKNDLYITRAKKRLRFGQRNDTVPSMFIEELKGKSQPPKNV